MTSLNHKFEEDDSFCANQNGPTSAGAKSELTSEIKFEHKDQLKLLIAELRKEPNSAPFNDPVPWQAMGLWNYPHIVKKPMDLQTVKNNVQDDNYKTFEEVFAGI